MFENQLAKVIFEGWELMSIPVCGGITSDIFMLGVRILLRRLPFLKKLREARGDGSLRAILGGPSPLNGDATCDHVRGDAVEGPTERTERGEEISRTDRGDENGRGEKLPL